MITMITMVPMPINMGFLSRAPSRGTALEAAGQAQGRAWGDDGLPGRAGGRDPAGAG